MATGAAVAARVRRSSHQYLCPLQANSRARCCSSGLKCARAHSSVSSQGCKAIPSMFTGSDSARAQYLTAHRSRSDFRAATRKKSSESVASSALAARAACVDEVSETRRRRRGGLYTRDESKAKKGRRVRTRSTHPAGSSRSVQEYGAASVNRSVIDDPGKAAQLALPLHIFVAMPSAPSLRYWAVSPLYNSSATSVPRV